MGDRLGFGRGGREVAIKVQPEHSAEDEERLQRFEREARRLASLNHRNVAQVVGVDQVDDTCFMVCAVSAAPLLASAGAENETRVAELAFARQIRPQLSGRCFTCHGPDEEELLHGVRERGTRCPPGSRARRRRRRRGPRRRPAARAADLEPIIARRHE